MKLKNILLSAVVANAAKYRDLLRSEKDGIEIDTTRSDGIIPRGFTKYEDCSDLEKSENAEGMVCSNHYCAMFCKSNYSLMPNGNNQFAHPKVKCKMPRPDKGYPEAYWSKDLASCKTCDNIDENGDPVVTDPAIDVQCDTAAGSNMRECKLQCMNGAKLEKQFVLATRCHCNKEDNQCNWLNKRKPIDLSKLKCPETEMVPSTCSVDKGYQCTTLTKNSITFKNSWTCRNCFRIQANYRFRSQGINNWEGQDYVDIDFSYKVFWISYGHPIASVEDMGRNRWRVYFKHDANFVSGMKWDANLRTVQNEWIKDGSIIRGAASCPCPNVIGATRAPWTKNT